MGPDSIQEKAPHWAADWEDAKGLAAGSVLAWDCNLDSASRSGVEMVEGSAVAMAAELALVPQT